VEYAARTFDVRLEAKDSALTAAPLAGDAAVFGARTSVALSGRYHLVDSLWLTASHKQVVLQRGGGLGAINDTFTSLGAELTLNARRTLGLAVGYGPAAGVVLMGNAEVKDGAETYYASATADVDAPDVSVESPLSPFAPRTVSGARTQSGDGTVVFVEDTSSESWMRSGWPGRWESLSSWRPVSPSPRGTKRGARATLDTTPPLQRDAGSVSVSWVRERVRAYARAELRSERGQSLLEPVTQVNRVSKLFTGSTEVEVARNVAVAARLHFGDSVEPLGPAARLLEAT